LLREDQVEQHLIGWYRWCYSNSRFTSWQAGGVSLQCASALWCRVHAAAVMVVCVSALRQLCSL